MLLFEGMNFLDLLKYTAAIIGAITTISGFLFMVSKKIRGTIKSKVRNWSGYEENCDRDEQTRKEFEETLDKYRLEFESMKEFFVQKLDQIQTDFVKMNNELLEMNNKLMRTEDLEKKQLRAIITGTYYEYADKQSLPFYIHKELVETYAKYKDEYGGNSHATVLYDEMMKWKVENIDH